MNESSFREMMVFPSGAHKIVVRRPADVDLDTAATVVSGIAAATGDGINVMTWKDLNPIVAQMLEGTRGIIMFMFFIVYVAVGILILNAMLMAVFERIREFGVLKALGVGPLKVFSLILVESGVQACIAAVVGFVLALPGMWYLSEHGIAVGALGGTDLMGVAMRPVWYGIYSPEGLVGPFVMLFFVVGFAVVYPALKAAWIRPIEAMHHQ
jgi:ABC-type lipoprotein release transport system permease subunit